MTLWANILEVILEFLMIVILLIIQGNKKELYLQGTLQSIKLLLLSFDFIRESFCITLSF